MRVSDDIADLTLHHLGRSGRPAFVVVIGAMDGVSFDDFHGYIAGYAWRGLFVEPMPEQFRRLRANYAALPQPPDNRYENCAVAEHDGTIEMLTISQAAVDAGEVHPCFGGMSAIYPPRNGLAGERDAAVVARYGERVTVPCLTLPTLLRRHDVRRIDVFCIDAEGWDYRILRQLDFAAYRPALIRCEYINLAADEQAAAVALLTEHDYVVRIDGQNLDAVTREYWAEVQRDRVPAPAPPRPGPPTLVTALFDLSADEPDLRLRHRFAQHLDHCKRLLAVDWPLLVFAPPELEELIRRYRPPALTHVVPRPRASLEAFPFLPQAREIQARAAAGGGARRHSVRALPLYPAWALSKQFFLNDAAIYNPFDTDCFVWADPDVAARVGDPTALFTDESARNLTALMADHRVLYLTRPARLVAEAPDFPRAALAQRLGGEPDALVLGQLFGGTRQALNAVNGVYYGCVANTLAAGLLGCEDEVLTLVAATHPHLCTLQRLEGDADLRTFLERLQYGVPGRAEAR